MSDTSPHCEPEAETAPGAMPGAERAKKTAERLATNFAGRQNRELVFYLSLAVIFVELLITLVALCYGIITAKPPASGGIPQFNFPWIPYFTALVVAPAALLLMVHLTGIGLLRSLRGHEEDSTWQEKLPQRIRRVYTLIQGAPVVVLLFGILALGALLFFMDGALGLLLHLGRSLEVYLPWILGSIAFLIGAALACRLRLKYLNAKLTEEYAFRREVLAKTGVIIVDKGSMPLPPGEYTHAALPAGVETALPQTDETVIDVTSYSPAEQEAFSTEQDAAKAEISPDIISDSAHGTEKPDLVAENSSASSGDTLRHSRQI